MKASSFAIAALLIPAACAQTATDWPSYNRDLTSTRYSPLKQINAANVSKLAQAWSYRLRPDANSPPAGTLNEVTPIVVNGVMYLAAGNRVVALDPDTGTEIWRYDVKSGAAASQRGVSYWAGDKQNPPRILFLAGHTMVALNASTGKLDPGFANEGILTMDVPFAGVPTIYKNMILVGMNMFGPGEEHLHQQDELPGGMPGDSRAYDVRTGKKLWEFHAVPQPGDPGHEDWKEGNWHRAGNNMWSYAMSVDEKRGLVYMPMGGPAANYYGGDRKGNNLYANSIVAVDYQTGKLKWYFQTVHHELWDYDLPPDPVLIDIVKDGKKIPALVQTGKTGLMFILDRVTGKPVFGVEERPVAQGDVPGEWYSRTQPFPVKPPPLARLSILRADIVTADETSADHAKACQELWDKRGYQDAGPYAPWNYQAQGTPKHETISMPGPTGGTNWGGAAADPETGFVFVNSQDSPGTGWMMNNPKANEPGALPYVMRPGFFSFSAPYKDAEGKTLGNLPCIKPPWERLFAVNANTGDIAWQVPLGVTDFLPPDKRNTGRSGAFAGPIATAGGLVFIGATSDARFRAFDSKTGKILWEKQLQYTATANPMTYLGKNGKQYVAIVSAGPGKGNDQALLVFALP